MVGWKHILKKRLPRLLDRNMSEGENLLRSIDVPAQMTPFELLGLGLNPTIRSGDAMQAGL